MNQEVSSHEPHVAERLFRFQTTGDWDTFHSVLPAYASALGQSGLGVYRELVKTAWKRLPPLGPKAPRAHFGVGRFRIEQAMAELAEFSGDIDALIRVKSHNLSSPHAILELAELLRCRGGHDEALAAKALQHLWALVRAEESPNAKRLPGWQPPIRSVLVAIHVRQKESEKAWEVYCGGPVDVRLWDKVAAMRGKTHPDDSVGVYRRLLPHAVAAGTRRSQYDEAFEIVKAMRDLCSAQGQDALFRQKLAECQATWRAKRNFVKLLATLG